MGILAERAAKLLTPYQSRPVSVQAVQITHANAMDVAAMVNGRHYGPSAHAPHARIYFHCCGTRVKAGTGDWVLRTPSGFTVMTDTDFTTIYQENP